MLSGNSAICHRPLGFSCSTSIAANSPTQREGATEIRRGSATLRLLFLEFVWATLPAVGCPDLHPAQVKPGALALRRISDDDHGLSDGSGHDRPILAR